MDKTSKEDIVRVSLRIRPLLIDNHASSAAVDVVSKQPPVLCFLDRAQTYHFDNLFTDETDQEFIYNTSVKQLVHNVKAGYNSTVFAYGQTGTGKTYTIGTNPDITRKEEKGLISRALQDFFNYNDTSQETEISISFIEIYNEKVFDLLNADNNKGPLQVKGFTVHGFKQEKVFNVYDAETFLKMGGKRRHVGGTKQNLNSSRSHAIFAIYCRTRCSNHETFAKLNLVDLAGSERVRKTGNEGSSFHEGININKGLLCLGQVMTALSNNSSHIPYRRSIITTILQDSLNKKNFVSLIACINSNSEDASETLQTLEFASRVKRMKNKPEVNEIISQYKQDNPDLFTASLTRGFTPSKRPNSTQYETPFKKPKFTLPRIEEHSRSSDFSNSGSKSLMLLASLSSIVSNEYNSQDNLTPVFERHMNKMESSLMNKLEQLFNNTIQRPVTRQSFLRSENKENCSTPSFSWDKVAKVVRAEILQLTGNIARATSSPLEGECEEPKSILNNKSGNILKVKKLLTYDSIPDSSVTSENGYAQETQTVNEMFKIPAPILLKNTRPRRSSVRLQVQSKTESPIKIQAIPSTNTRRSIRLQVKEAAANVKNDLEDSFVSDFVSSKKSVWMPKKQQMKKLKINPRDSPSTVRSKNVLHTLNNGDLKDVQKLHTIGVKTAEKILLYRQVIGCFKAISDLSAMLTSNKYNKFIKENFLKVDQ